jgi:serine/threonine protein kinase
MITYRFSAEGGELFQRVCVDENFDEQESRRFMSQILEGVLFLHQHNVVHLDIKVTMYTCVYSFSSHIIFFFDTHNTDYHSHNFQHLLNLKVYVATKSSEQVSNLCEWDLEVMVKVLLPP